MRLHYLEWGAADLPALLLLHGFANQAHMWDLFAPTVADRYHVFALDFRGHGDSDHAETYGDEANLNDTLQVIEHLGLERLSLLGFSMGGAAAMLTTARLVDRVSRLVIVDRGPETSERGRERMARALRQARPSFASREEALAYIRLANPKRPEALVERSLEHAFRRLEDGSYRIKYDPRLRDGFIRGDVPRLDLWQALRSIHCPTLIVRGGDSDILAPDVAEKMLETVPGSCMETVPGAGHNVAQDQPEAFNRVVGGFL